MLNSHFIGVDAFETLETLATIKLEDVQNSLSELFDTSKAAISIIKAN